MKVLGIESTAHTFGVGIACDEEPYILSNVKDTFVPKEGGMKPGEVARHHSEVAPDIVVDALSKAGVTISSVDGIAISLGPGLGPVLRVGATVARALALKYRKPLIPVNHGIGHIEIGRLTTESNDPLILYLSGGNTIITVLRERRYRILGETLDIALGNMIDVFVREVGLAPPYVKAGKHMIDVCAEKGSELVELPYVVKGQDMSFSGLLTAALRATKNHNLNDVCFSLREIAFDMLIEASERALSLTGKREILVVGGVAASQSLKEKLDVLSEERDVILKIVSPEFAGDNGAMIAYAGLLLLKHGVRINIEESYVRPRWRIEEVDIPWS
ncbi:protein kinase [Sulfolobales archaeon HS-7]|nr:protein kinase [Sulfolobales archaeon HS-7]